MSAPLRRRRRRLRTIAALLLAACTSPEERLAEHVERGDAYVEEERPADALLEFRNALKIQPDNAELHERIGDTLAAQGRPSEALEYYRQSDRLDPHRISPAMKLAMLIAFEDPQRASALVKRGLKRAPNSALVHRTHSHVSLAAGKAGPALDAAEKAVKLEPRNDTGWLQLARAHQARIGARQQQGETANDGVFEATLASLQRIDQLLSGSPRAQLEQARVLSAWPGHRNQAIRRYKQALKLAKQGGDTQQIHGVALAIYEFARASGNRALHRFALWELVEVDDADYGAWDELGRLAQSNSQKNGAEVYRKLLEQRPDDRRSHLLYVSSLVRNGQRGAAAQHLEKTLKGGFEDPALWEWLLRLSIQAGRLVDARAAYDRLVDAFPDAFATRVARARIALNEGRDALPQLRELTEENPTTELLRLLAVAEFRAGHLREARRAINKALIRSTPPAPGALRIKARIAGAAQDWDALLAAHWLLLAGGETLSSEERLLQARALYATGRARDGRALLEQILKSPDVPSGAALSYAEHEGKRHPARAHGYLRIAHQRQPADYDDLKALTEFEMRTAPSPRTLKRLDRLVANRFATPGTLLLRARLLAQQGAYDKAEADVLRAYEAAPSLPGAIDVLFAIYRAQGKLEESRRSFEQAEAAGVLHSGARLLLARFYLNDGDTDRAREMMEQVVADHPKMWSAKKHLAFVLAEQGEDFDRALALAREAHAGSQGSPETADLIGWVHLKAGRSEAALVEFRRSIALAGASDAVVDASIHYHLGLTLQALGRNDEAAEAFEQALGRDPDFPEAEDARRQLEAARHPESGSASSS